MKTGNHDAEDDSLPVQAAGQVRNDLKPRAGLSSVRRCSRRITGIKDLRQQAATPARLDMSGSKFRRIHCPMVANGPDRTAFGNPDARQSMHKARLPASDCRPAPFPRVSDDLPPITCHGTPTRILDRSPGPRSGRNKVFANTLHAVG